LLELKAPQHVEPDGMFIINTSYSNIGTAPAEDTLVKVTLPARTTFVSAAAKDGTNMPPAANGNELTWQIGTLAPEECCQHIFITAKVDDNLAEESQLTTQDSIGSTTEEISTTNNTASFTSTVCEMAGSTKQVNQPEVKPGDVLTYTLTLRLRLRTGHPALE
jgi:hypothetical protein